MTTIIWKDGVLAADSLRTTISRKWPNLTVCKLHIFNQQNVPWNSETEEFVLAAGFAGDCSGIDRFASTIFDKAHNDYDVSKSISALIANTFERPSFGGIFVTNKGVYRLSWAERMECKKYSHDSTLTMGSGTHVFKMLRLPYNFKGFDSRITFQTGTTYASFNRAVQNAIRTKALFSVAIGGRDTCLSLLSDLDDEGKLTPKQRLRYLEVAIDGHPINE